MSAWFDNTTYPPGARGRIEPLSWYLNTGRVSMSVVRRGDDVWFMICAQAGMHDYQLLDAKTAADAQAEAIKIVREKLREKLASMPRSSPEAEMLREDMKTLPKRGRGLAI